MSQVVLSIDDAICDYIVHLRNYPHHYEVVAVEKPFVLTLNLNRTEFPNYSLSCFLTADEVTNGVKQQRAMQLSAWADECDGRTTSLHFPKGFSGQDLSGTHSGTVVSHYPMEQNRAYPTHISVAGSPNPKVTIHPRRRRNDKNWMKRPEYRRQFDYLCAERSSKRAEEFRQKQIMPWEPIPSDSN